MEQCSFRNWNGVSTNDKSIKWDQTRRGSDLSRNDPMSLQREIDWQILEGAKIGILYEDRVARICKPRIAESARAMTITEDRYRMLLGASTALADQPTVKAVLHSLRGVLSSTSRLHGAELYVLSDDGESLSSFEFDRDIGTLPQLHVEPNCCASVGWPGAGRTEAGVCPGPVAEDVRNILTWLLLQPKLPDEPPIFFPYRPRKNATEFFRRQSCRASNSPPKTSRCSVPWPPTWRSRSSAHWQGITRSFTTEKS